MSTPKEEASDIIDAFDTWWDENAPSFQSGRPATWAGVEANARIMAWDAWLNQQAALTELRAEAERLTDALSDALSVARSERDCYIERLVNERAATKVEVERLKGERDEWKEAAEHNFSRRLAALGAVQPDALARDGERLDFIESRRVSVIPEFEGPWDATVYDDDGEPQFSTSGHTPREAIDAALAATKETQR